MITPSALLREASKYSHSTRCVVDVWRAGALLLPNVPVVDGQLTADRSQKTRLAADVTLALNSWEATGIDPRLCRFTIRRGLTSLGVNETMTLGWFRVDDVARSDAGAVDLQGSGLEAYVVDARFLQPRTPPRGEATVGAIIRLITEVLPGAHVRIKNTANKLVQASAAWERERWDAIEALAESINAEVFVDHGGDFIIADVPSITTGAQVVVFDDGDGGLLVDRKMTETRDQVYNAVSVAGSSSDPNVPPVWAAAYDLDVNSDTYFYGAFGQVPRFYTSQFFTSSAQCQAVANELLAQSLAANTNLSFASLPMDYVEVGDLVGVRHADGTLQSHLIQKTTASLGTAGGLKCETLSSKAIARDDI